ncbi:efflux RND transporter periplasmic adaptor subunit [bacterium]|nr:efflux RND transporter periplasmic adaptor subunit [bacterium]
MAVKRRNIMILVVVAALVAVAVIANIGLDRKERTDVTVEEVERGTLVARVSGPGRVRAEKTVQISSSVMGRIVDLAVDEGDVVSGGQFLLRLDDIYYRSLVAQSEASVARSEARLATAERDLSDYEEQFAAGLVSERERDEIYATAVSARQSRQEARASLSAAQDQLDKTVFHAPIDGVITRLNVEQGENVVTGTMNAPGTVILTISDLSDMEVEVEIDETDIVDVWIGQKAEIEVEALADTVLVGTVTEVGNSGLTSMAGTQEEVTNFLVKVLVDEWQEGLKPGMTATVDIITAEHVDALNVPIQSVVARTELELEKESDEGGKDDDKAEAPKRRSDRKEEKDIEGIFVVDENDESRFVAVTTGIADELSIEVISDELTEGQRVISGPYRVLRTLKNGAALKIEEKSDNEKTEE